MTKKTGTTLTVRSSATGKSAAKPARKPSLHSLAKNSGEIDGNQARGLRKDRKMQRTRRHLAEAATRLFDKKGYAATTVDEIADAADYSTSTFFRLFVDKEEVIFYDFVERLDELKVAFARPHPGNAWLMIRAAFIEFARRWDEEGELAKLRARLFHSEPSLKSRYLAKNNEWEHVIAELVSAELGARPDVQLASHLIAGAAVAAFRSAWHAQMVGENLVLADCVAKAFDQLEGIGQFFRSAPPAARSVKSAKALR